MKIIESGRKNRIINCVCGCIFEYDDCDIGQNLNINCYPLINTSGGWVKCPECGALYYVYIDSKKFINNTDIYC